MATFQGQAAQGELPVHFRCPLSFRPMADPVVAADGITYERCAIEDWIEEKGAVGVYGSPLPSTELSPNFSLKAAIENFMHATSQAAPSLPGDLDGPANLHERAPAGRNTSEMSDWEVLSNSCPSEPVEESAPKLNEESLDSSQASKEKEEDMGVKEEEISVQGVRCRRSSRTSREANHAVDQALIGAPVVEEPIELDAALPKKPIEERRPRTGRLEVVSVLVVFWIVLMIAAYQFARVFDGMVEKRFQQLSQSIDESVEKRLKEHSRRLLKVVSPDMLTMTAGIEDGYVPPVEWVQKLCRDKPRKAEVFLTSWMESGLNTQLLVNAGCSVQQLLEAGARVEGLLADGISTAEVADALARDVPKPPKSSEGAVVTYIFQGPMLQQYREDGILDLILSEELQWDGTFDSNFSYHFRLAVAPNSDREGLTGALSLFWALRYGPDGEQRTWPMPYERCTVTLRLLCARSAPFPVENKVLTLDGRVDKSFRDYLTFKVPQNGTLPSRGYGSAKFLSAGEASSGYYFLGPLSDTLVVQAELRLV